VHNLGVLDEKAEELGTSEALSIVEGGADVEEALVLCEVVLSS